MTTNQVQTANQRPHIDPHAFIARPALDGLLRQLDTRVMSMGVTALVGPTGSGKTAMLDHWIKGGSSAVTPRNAVYISLDPGESGKLMVTCTVLSRIKAALEQIAPAVQLVNRGYPRARPIKEYNKRQLESLRNEVARQLNDLHIKVIVVDNAHFLDADALSWLLNLKVYYKPDALLRPRRAIVLSTTVDEKTSDERGLPNLLRNRADTKAVWGDKLSLGRVTTKEFKEVVGSVCRTNLWATFHPEVDVDAFTIELWRRSRGNWHHLMAFAATLDQELGPLVGSERRIITRPILERVWTRLSGLDG